MAAKSHYQTFGTHGRFLLISASQGPLTSDDQASTQLANPH